MKQKQKEVLVLPTKKNTEQEIQRTLPNKQSFERELERLKYYRRFFNALKSTIGTLLVAAAVVVLIATIWLPVLRIHGTSMTPTLNEGEIIVAVTGRYEAGDVVGLYIGSRLLVKRVIAGPGQWVNLDEDGTVYVDGERLEEPYLTEKAMGDCNIELPYQVPEARFFVMGDHRSTSADSRNSAFGCIADEEIVGRIVLRVWPLNRISLLGR